MWCAEWNWFWGAGTPVAECLQPWRVNPIPSSRAPEGAFSKGKGWFLKLLSFSLPVNCQELPNRAPVVFLCWGSGSSGWLRFSGLSVSAGLVQPLLIAGQVSCPPCGRPFPSQLNPLALALHFCPEWLPLGFKTLAFSLLTVSRPDNRGGYYQVLGSKERHTVPVTRETFQTAGWRADFVEASHYFVCVWGRPRVIWGQRLDHTGEQGEVFLKPMHAFARKPKQH